MTDCLPLLAFDTSGPYCAAYVLGPKTAYAYEPMQRGQSERLMPLCQEVLTKAGLTWQDIKAVAVGVGPGNFTGIRIGVSAARGLALGLGIASVGVDKFRITLHGRGFSAPVLVSLAAPAGMAYVQTFLHGKPLAPPQHITVGACIAGLQMPGLRVIGHEAVQIAKALGAVSEDAPGDCASDAEVSAKIAAIAHNDLQQGQPIDRPKPIYVKPPDAAPSKVAAPILLT